MATCKEEDVTVNGAAQYTVSQSILHRNFCHTSYIKGLGEWTRWQELICSRQFLLIKCHLQTGYAKGRTPYEGTTAIVFYGRLKAETLTANTLDTVWSADSGMSIKVREWVWWLQAYNRHHFPDPCLNYLKTRKDVLVLILQSNKPLDVWTEIDTLSANPLSANPLLASIFGWNYTSAMYLNDDRTLFVHFIKQTFNWVRSDH